MKVLGALVLSVFVLACPRVALSQIVNGDFSDGLNGWTVEQPLPSKPYAAPTHGWQIDALNGEATFLVTATETPAEEGHIRQDFLCGTAPAEGDSCRITFDYRLINHSGDPEQAEILAYLDLEPVFRSQELSENLEFSTATVTVPCGSHQIRLALFVDTGIGGWTASFDNVTATCSGSTPVEPATWGRIKRLFP